MDNFTPDFLNTLCVNVARQLNQLPHELQQAEGSARPETQLIFPATAAKEVRVSEQEARFLFTQQLEQYEICYAIETPTLQRYRFEGTQGGRSASTDVTLFERSPDRGFTRKIQFELKAHNVHPKNIEKDFEKLLSEQECGVFFHILKSANSGTLTSDKSTKGVLVKYRTAFTELLDRLNPEKDTSWFLHFVVFCMKPSFIISKTVTAKNFRTIKRFFDFQYRVSGGEMSVIDNNGWNVLNF
ncbi:MAG: hypothetical protein D3925_03715 [Candidatus Electrothrix sp. AR5]|nr:hypothetical protein [Candidatus Electrothrix sp. AR5]